MDTGLVIMFGLFELLAGILIIKELFNLRDYRYTFKCEHCGHLEQELDHKHRCTQCHRNFKDIKKEWDHFLTFRVNTINTRDTHLTFRYKKYLLPFKIELALDISGFIVIGLFLIITIMGVQK